MKKELQIAAKLNFEDFDKTVGDLQRKLKDLYAPSNAALAQQQLNQRLGPLGLGNGQANTPAAQNAYRVQTQQTRREMDQSLASEVRQQEKLAKLIVQRQDTLKKLQDQQKEVVKGTKEELDLREKIAKVQENNARNLEQYRNKDGQINQLVGMREQMQPSAWGRLSTAYQQGGLGGAATAAGRMWNQAPMGTKIGIGASVVGGIGSALAAGNSLYRYFGQAPIEATANMGSAIGGTFGTEIGNAYSGRSALDMAFLPEKAAAARMAMESVKRTRATQGGDILSSVLGQGAAGAAGGMVLGGLMGGLPAIPAAAIGGLGGIGSALWSADKNVLFSGVSGTASKARSADLAKQFSSNYQSALEGQKQANPLKTMAAEEYSQNYQRNLDFQRSVGLDNVRFHGPGGFRQSAIDAGFMDTQAMGMSSGILGSGGSTRMAQDSVIGLQAQRAYGISNAGGVLGKLSSSLGDSESSKKAFIEMIAEGNRRGLDSSQYAEEQRKFLDATASVIASSGSQSQGDISGLTKRFGGFVNDNTTRGVESAQGAYQMFNDQGSQTAGPRGVMRFAAMRKDPLLSRMSGIDQAAAMSLGDDQITADNPVIRSLARQYGSTPEDFVKSLKSADDASRNRLAKTDALQTKGRTLKDAYEKEQDPLKKIELQKQYGEVFEDLSRQNMLERPELGKDQTKLKSYTSGQLGGLMDFQMGGKTADMVRGDLSNKDTGRIEDQTTQSNAEASRLVLDNFAKMKDQLIVTSDQMAVFNKALQQTVEIAMKMSGDERNSLLAPFSGILKLPQTQAGKPSK